MKRTLVVLLTFVALFAVTLAVMAQGAADSSLPVSKLDFWNLATAAITPMLVLLVSKVIPVIPRSLLPILSPFVGIAIGAALNAIGAHSFSWYDSAAAGALGVFVREVVNQQVTKRLAGDSGPS